MGEFVRHHHVPMTQARVNFRFAHGDALKEMVAFQKHFEVFADKHPLSRSFALVDAAPHDARERSGFFRYLDRLKSVGSNVKGLDGHAAVVRALKKNLKARIRCRFILPIMSIPAAVRRSRFLRRSLWRFGREIPHDLLPLPARGMTVVKHARLKARVRAHYSDTIRHHGPTHSGSIGAIRQDRSCASYSCCAFASLERRLASMISGAAMAHCLATLSTVIAG